MTVSANSAPSALAGSVECGEVYEDESAAHCSAVPRQDGRLGPGPGETCSTYVNSAVGCNGSIK